MSSPHFNSITAIGCLLCYIHVFLAVLGNSFVYGKGNRSVCVVSSSGNQLILHIAYVMLYEPIYWTSVN